MMRHRNPYAPEFRAQLVELVKAGRRPFRTGWPRPIVKSWRCYDARTVNSSSNETSSQKPRHGSRGRPGRCPTGVHVHEGEPGLLADYHHGAPAGCLPQRLPCVASTSTLEAFAGRYRAAEQDPCATCALTWHLRGTAHPRRAGRARHPRRAQARCAPDARGWTAWGMPTALDKHHAAQCSRGRHRTSCGWLMRPTYRPTKVSCISRWCWTCSAAASSAGSWRTPVHRADAAGAGHGLAATPTQGRDPSLRSGLPSTPRSPSASVAAKRACAPQWARWAMPTTTPCARASSPHSNGSCSPASAWPPARRLSVPCLPSSRAGTTPRACTAASATARPWATSSSTMNSSPAGTPTGRSIPHDSINCLTVHRNGATPVFNLHAQQRRQAARASRIKGSNSASGGAMPRSTIAACMTRMARVMSLSAKTISVSKSTSALRPSAARRMNSATSICRMLALCRTFCASSSVQRIRVGTVRFSASGFQNRANV